MHGAVSKAQATAGSSRILDSNGMMVSQANAERGGWEVEVLDQTKQELVQRHTWIATQREALNLAVSLVSSTARCNVVHILDYTHRPSGPKLWKAIG
jgi:hypothetical protein